LALDELISSLKIVKRYKHIRERSDKNKSFSDKYVFFLGTEVKYREPLWLTNEKEKGVNSLVKKEVIKIGQTKKGKEKKGNQRFIGLLI